MFFPVFPIEFRLIVDCFDHRHFHVVQGVSGKVEVLSRGFFKMVIPDVSQVLGESTMVVGTPSEMESQLPWPSLVMGIVTLVCTVGTETQGPTATPAVHKEALLLPVCGQWLLWRVQPIFPS